MLRGIVSKRKEGKNVRGSDDGDCFSRYSGDGRDCSVYKTELDKVQLIKVKEAEKGITNYEGTEEANRLYLAEEGIYPSFLRCYISFSCISGSFVAEI